MWLGWGREPRGKLRVLEHAGCRETGVGTMEGGRGSSESLETPTMLSLSTQSRKQSQSREYTRSVFVSRTASSFSICSLSSCRRRRVTFLSSCTRDLVIRSILDQQRPRFGGIEQLEERRLANFSSFFSTPSKDRGS